MHRCFAEPDRWKAEGITLTAEETAHLVTVLRASPGDRAILFDGQGRVAHAEIVSVSKREARLRLSGEISEHPRPSPAVTLIQAIPKGNHMDQIVEKATELGTSAIVPVITDRTVRRPGASPHERWRRIAIGAAKQCGTPWVPEIGPVVSLAEALTGERASFDLWVVGSLESDSRPVKEVLRGCGDRTRIGFLVGPEGDLTPEEYAMARNAGAIPVSFGNLVLRVETAAIFGLSVIRYESTRTPN